MRLSTLLAPLYSSRWVLPAIALFCFSPFADSAELTLAREGKAQVKIVRPANPIPAETTAVSELADYLQKVCGATFEVVDETALPADAAAICVGPTAFAAAQGIDTTRLGAEDSVLKTVGNRLILAGGRPRGTLYAVYEFLAGDLGVRWYTPWCEKVPAQANLTIAVPDRQVKPYMMFRSQYTHLGGAGWKQFNARNRLNEPSSGALDAGVGGGVAYGGRIFGGHGFAPYLPTDTYFKEHPEYYSLRDGKRVPSNGLDGNHACLTHPDVLKIITAGVFEDIQKDPNGFCYTVAVNDGGSATLCDCPKCREVATQYGASAERCTDAGLLLWFVNQVADAVAAKYPDKFIRTLAYGPASRPPKNITARDNVIVHICAGPRSEAVYLPRGNGSTELQNLREWTPFAKHIWVWDYALGCYNYPSFFRPITWKMDQQMKFFRQLAGIDGMFQENELMMAEDSIFPQFYEMNMWVYMQLCRDPLLDVNVLAADFVNGYYGPAVAPMILKYLDLIRARLPLFPYRTFTFAFMRDAQALFDQAEAAAQAQTVYLDRVRELHLQLDLSALAWRNNLTADFLRTGGTIEQYPFRVPLLKARLLETLKNTTHPYLLGITPRYSHKGRPAHQKVMEIVPKYIEEIGAGAEVAPLPSEFAALPPERVIDLTAPLLSKTIFPIVVPDPDAALGLAYSRPNADELPVTLGFYHSVNPAQLGGGGRDITAKDIPGAGYHWYKSPRFKLTEWTFLYVLHSWQLQKHLYTLYDPAHPEQEWQYHVSMKFTGPAYPFGTANEPNGLLIDRLILVQVAPAQEKK